MNILEKMIDNHKIFAIELMGVLSLELHWGWENGEGKFSLELFNFFFLKDYGDIFLLQIKAWILSFTIGISVPGVGV